MKKENKKENQTELIWDTFLLEEHLKSEHEKKTIQTVLQKQDNNYSYKKIKKL